MALLHSGGLRGVINYNTAAYARQPAQFRPSNEALAIMEQRNRENQLKLEQQKRENQLKSLLGSSGSMTSGGSTQGIDTSGTLASLQGGTTTGGGMLSADAKAANEAQYQLAKTNLEDEYRKATQATQGNLLRRGLESSSVESEDYGEINKALAQGLAELEQRRQAGSLATQGQTISNQSALQNMAIQQQQLALQQRQQQQAEQLQLMKLLGY